MSYRRILTTLCLSLLAALSAAATCRADDAMVIHTDRPTIRISPTLYGMMTEEINHSYDGGLYAELIQNRTFQDNATTPVHWMPVGGGEVRLSLDRESPLSTALPVSLQVQVMAATVSSPAGVANEGYWGIPVKPHTRYRASFYARANAGFRGPLLLSIESADGSVTYASARVTGLTSRWKQFRAALETGKVTPTDAARFAIKTHQPATVNLNLVSLSPPTFHNRPNGNRPDLMNLMAGMHPAFLRLPGGNYLEGDTIPERFIWEKTLGPLTERPGHQGPWGYRSSDGLGLLEYLEWCEDLKIEPILGVYAGYSLRGDYIEPGPALEPYVQSALNEIEYVTGGTDTKWGAERARNGHPAPFPLHYVEIGNEDFFDRSGSYEGRFAQFQQAIRARYPQLQIIATMPVRTVTPDLVDDHYYRSAAQMERDAGQYDHYSRTGPKIFVGEWASTEGNPTPNMNAALGDAAWLIGLERNSDLVVLSSYAPLLVNVNKGAYLWGTNLIGLNALTSFGSPSYYVQKMYAENRGVEVLESSLTLTPDQNPPPLPSGAVGVGTWQTQADFKDVQVTHDGKTLYQTDFSQGAGDWKLGNGEWAVREGMLEQTGTGINCRALAGDPGWTDYTYTLKARKLGGREGFLILFHVQSPDTWVWWNIGGWGNTRTRLQRAKNGLEEEFGNNTPMRIETGRWYDIRIEVQGRRIACYLDNKLVSQAVDTPLQVDPLYTEASRMADGTLIVKVVNVTDAPRTVNFTLEGAARPEETATLEQLQGNPAEVNTIADPEHIVPHTLVIHGVAPAFSQTFPAHSVNILRIKTR